MRITGIEDRNERMIIGLRILTNIEATVRTGKNYLTEDDFHNLITIIDLYIDHKGGNK